MVRIRGVTVHSSQFMGTVVKNWVSAPILLKRTGELGPVPMRRTGKQLQFY